jgi:competence protein ComFC
MLGRLAQINNWVKTAADLLWPRSCFSCDTKEPQALLPEVCLCQSCYTRCPPIEPPFCERCGETFLGAIDGAFTCGNCQGRKAYHLDFGIAGYHFDGPVRELVHGLKFENQYENFEPLGWLAGHALKDSRIAARRDWIVVPVPLHKLRMREREYNQSALIGKVVAKMGGFLYFDGLARVRDTHQQSSLSRQDRLENLKNAFALRPRAIKERRFQNQAILLVDDVFTTGATADECARILKKEGKASTVVALTVARG